MREKALQNIIEFLKRLKYFDIISDEDKYESFIQGLTVDQFTNLLITFNAKLRGIKTSEKGFQEDGFMSVGKWISPSKDVQIIMLERLLNAIKKLDNNKDRATLTYYMLLDLHMFEDGNGRTARLFYDLISGNDDFINNIDWYIHNEEDISQYMGSFELEKNIADITEVNNLIGFSTMKELSETGIDLTKKIGDKSIEVYRGKHVKDNEGFPVSDDIKRQLSQEEKDNINFLLLDNYGKYSVGGLTLLIMALKKGQLEEWIKRNDEQTRTLIEVYPNSKDSELRKKRFVFSLAKNPDMFDEWTLEDYRDAVGIAKEIKKKQLSHLIGLFLDSDSYILEESLTYKQYVYNEYQKKENKDTN